MHTDSTSSRQPVPDPSYPPSLHDTIEQSAVNGHPYRPPQLPNGSASRDPSVTRGRRIHAPAQSQGILPSSRTASAHPTIPEGEAAGSVIALDTGLQRRTSNRHHRQTSVINGLQHSRNPSFNSPLTSSPLSPESLHNANLRNVATRRGPTSAFDMDSPSAPLSTFSHFHAPSIDSTLNMHSSHSGSTASDLTHSSGARGRTHQSGTSLNARPDGRTPSEYAMHHLLNAFVIRADQKINQCLSKLESLPLPVEQVCGPGADPAFDQLLLALGHVTRQQPKPLVDSLMLWRQNKADTANAARKQLAAHRSPSAAGTLPMGLLRRHTEPVNDVPGPHPGVPVAGHIVPDEFGPEEYITLDRQATVSVFILCRGLMEVFEQSTLDAITVELAMKLEDIVFEQLKTFEPQQMNVNKIRTANWKIYGELLGCMSGTDFARVTYRYLQQLKNWQQEITTVAATTAKAREVESRIEILLLSMHHLRISADHVPFTQTSDFLNAFALCFANAHGPRIKQSYCATFEALLRQIASQATVTERDPKFKEFTDVVNPRINQMLTKMRHWACALPTSIIMLCLSPLDVFHAQWMPQINALGNKLRDRATRTPAMRAISQLVWAYLTRSTDSALTKTKKIEDILRLTFPSGKKPHLSTEASMLEATLCFIRLIGLHYPDICFRQAIFPLVNPDGVLSMRDGRIDQLEPEKVTIGIKAFLQVIQDQETLPKRWPFPDFQMPLPASDAVPVSPMPFALSQATEPQLSHKKVEFSVATTPIDGSALDDVFKNAYLQFCDMLGKIMVLCDGAFGSSVVWTEKFSSTTPKTPLVDAFTLNKRDEAVAQDQRYLYYELLTTAIQALPRCLSDNVPVNPLINLLCTASAHVQPQIAAAATKSLKAIAGQGYAQNVATAFPRFIFNYDHQYSTMSDEGRLGPNHIETTLTLYLDLLLIWMTQIEKKAAASLVGVSGDTSVSRAFQMEMTSLMPLVEDIEGYGLFFLCSQSRRVRSYAVKVLQLVSQFDKVLGKGEQMRIITTLEQGSEVILDLADNSLNTFERSRLQKDRRRKGAQSVVIELSISENPHDSTLWFKAFPNMVRHVFEACPHAAALSRGFVCDRLALMLPDVERVANSSTGVRDFKFIGRSTDTPINVFFDQWQLYLVMACVTLSSTGGQSRGQLDNAMHSRKTSRNNSGLQDKLTSARALFSAVIPLLGSGVDALRSAVVTALGSINRKLYRILLESLQYAVITCNDEVKARKGAHQRTPSSPSRSQMTERMRAEVTCIYKLTAGFLRHDDILKDDWIVANLMNYAKDLRLFLSDNDVHSDWKYSRLRFHYCGLVEVLYDNIQRYHETSLFMSFESRKSAFMLMEEWCGYLSEAQGPFWPETESGDKSTIVKERISLRTAALSAMAALCAGPVSVITGTNTQLQFNVHRMLSWIDSIFTSQEHKLRDIGQRALRNLIVHNQGVGLFVEHAIQCCYGVKGIIALENCFKVIADVLTLHPQYPISSVKVLGAVIFTLGHDSQDIRIRSARLLRFLDDRDRKSSNLQHFDISISDRTRAVYKAAQFEYSRRLAQTHPDLAFHVFSEFCLQFRNVPSDIQRSMVAAILPWLQTLELQLLPNTNLPTDLSHMLLVNMVEITIRYGSSLHNEVQALWQALATGPYAGNVQLVLDFITELSLVRREQDFISCAKQIVVYLSGTPAGSKIFQHFLLQLAAKHMPNERKSMDQPLPAASDLPYVANLETVLPAGNRQASFSLGQISLILLVDLLVPPLRVSEADALKLIHAVFILWDHHMPLVQEHAREMLVHLMHTLVIANIETGAIENVNAQKTEELVEAVRSRNASISWSYGDFAGKEQITGTGKRVPEGMSSLADTIVVIFSSIFQDFTDAWAKEALHWASVCPVRHLACRSFQVYRCISGKIDSSLLSDMLARLSNTIAEEHADYQTFSLEILTTLRVVIADLDTKTMSKYPQLMWTTIACLNTIHESEFLECMRMLDQLADLFDFADPVAVENMLKARPAEWEGDFDGIEPLVYKGLRSSPCLEPTTSVLQKIISYPDSVLLGSDHRMLFHVLAHLPYILEQSKHPEGETHVYEHTAELSQIAGDRGYSTLQQALSMPPPNTADAGLEQVQEVLQALSSTFFPSAEADALIFTIGLLTNATAWFRVNILEVLCHLLPLVNMRNPRITGHGADLISPLLRLLQTDLCDQALKVLDLVMEVNVTPLERHHLRMSMASGPARAIRKEYERTQSLYGIPENSGWSVPTPAILSAQTRNNVHHVFFACGDPDSNGGTPSRTPDVEFHMEEDYQDSYFPSQLDSNGYNSFESTNDINLNDIVSSLDSLDDFFDENESPTTPTGEARTSGGINSLDIYGSDDHDTNVYDQQTAPIISRSFNRTSPSLSFHHSLADSRPPTGQYHRSQMSASNSSAFQGSLTSIEGDDGPGPSMPTIDRPSPGGPSSYAPPSRPGLHARSITSPANQFTTYQSTLGMTTPSLTTNTSSLSDTQVSSDEVLSDSENSPFPNLVPTISQGGSRSVNATPTSATDTSTGFMRRGMRRLTGGKSESAKEKARLRAPSAGQNTYNAAGSSAAGQSPRMPRIPSEYLSNNPAGSSPNPMSPPGV